jgi:secreted trypsin-like serine protease
MNIVRILFCLSFVVVGCGGAPVESMPAAATAGAPDATAAGAGDDLIQGGTVDGKYPAVGLVWIAGGGFCSGALIAPNVVLTAGHCVNDPVSAFYTGVGKGTTSLGRTPIKGFTSHKVIDQVAHPSYQDIDACPNPTFDVALLRLQKPIRSPAPFQVATAAPRAGATCTAVGYGVHDGASGERVVEQRRQASEAVGRVEQSAIEVEKRSGIVDHGDSGGPLLCGGKIVGVTSCGNDDSPSHTSAYYGRVDRVAAWIQSTVDAWQ